MLANTLSFSRLLSARADGAAVAATIADNSASVSTQRRTWVNVMLEETTCNQINELRFQLPEQ
jgi:hypothetical protein